ncbi:MAG: peptidylprolyl isomerase [Leptolyngbyaceae cyanobacterium bins.59]|nr:peptidylprolyl isomerase [Leptolyngbyaceae cyanobacterium bins.59]
MFTKVSRWLVSFLAIGIFLITACTSEPSANSAPATSSPAANSQTTQSPSGQTPKKDTLDGKSSGSGVMSSSEIARQNRLPYLEGNATIEITVNDSPIVIEVDGGDAPITAGNFVDLVNRGIYDGVVFHRVVREPQPFVVQGGDPQSKTGSNVPASRWGTGGFVDPATSKPRNIPLEIKPEGADVPLYSKTFEAARIPGSPKLKHKRGAVAMARSQMPDSASSQFYFTLSDLEFLDGNYAVFGYVTQGMNVVDKIQQGDRIQSAKVTKGLENLKASS